MPIRSLVVGTCSRETNIWRGGAFRDDKVMMRRYDVMRTCLTCDDQVVVLSADTKIKRVTHVVPVDEDGEVGVLYHGDGLTHYDQTDLKCQTND